LRLLPCCRRCRSAPRRGVHRSNGRGLRWPARRHGSPAGTPARCQCRRVSDRACRASPPCAAPSSGSSACTAQASTQGLGCSSAGDHGSGLQPGILHARALGLPLRGRCLQQLLRSRYSAFALAARKALKVSCRRNMRWIGLEVLDGQNGGPLDQHGTVTFDARWRDRDCREGVLPLWSWRGRRVAVSRGRQPR
jgi:hypothetical protein